MSINLNKEYNNDGVKKFKGATMEEMMEENLKLTREMHEMVKSIKSYVFWARIWGFLKIFLIIIPLIIGIMYLPPLLKNVTDQYKSLLGGAGDATDLLNSLDPSVLSGDLKNLIKQK